MRSEGSILNTMGQVNATGDGNGWKSHVVHGSAIDKNGFLGIAELDKTKIEKVFAPSANLENRTLFDTSEFVRLSVFHESDFCGGTWIFCPPPFYMAFKLKETHEWLAVGIIGEAGKNFYTALEYNRDGLGKVMLDFETKDVCQGNEPRIEFLVKKVAEPWDGLEDFVLAGRKLGRFPLPQKQAWWWGEPVFCGWGEQTMAAKYENANGEAVAGPPAVCTQSHYERFLKEMRNNQIKPGTVIIDDGWSIIRGMPRVDSRKWPDMRGFINRCHAEDIHVMLWLGTSLYEGLACEDCVGDGEFVRSADITEPMYRNQLSSCIENLIGSKEGQMNADGFKVDYAQCSPSLRRKPDFDWILSRVANGNAKRLPSKACWGVEWQRSFLEIVNETAKSIKEDALIETQTPHPYLTDLVSVIRLNDLYVRNCTVVEAGATRAKIAKHAMAGLLIDTDNHPFLSYSDYLEYIKSQPELGIPAIYNTKYIDYSVDAKSLEPRYVTEEGYELIRNTWSDYRKSRAMRK